MGQRPKKIGRPTKKTPAALDIVKDWLEHGCTRKAAGAAAGISKDTFCAWMKDKPDFSDLVVRAEAKAERRWIVRSESEKPGASIKLLSKRFREDWGDVVELQHSGSISVEYTNDWRGKVAIAPPWTADSTTTGEAVQLAGSGPSLAEDDDVPVDSG